MTEPKTISRDGWAMTALRTYFVVALFEGFNVSPVSPSDPFRGIALSLVALLIGAAFLPQSGGADSRSFMFGFAGCQLLLPRLLFTGFLENGIPDASGVAVVLIWLLFSGLMGLACLLVVRRRSPAKEIV
jgi:hypothetical protein